MSAKGAYALMIILLVIISGCNKSQSKEKESENNEKTVKFGLNGVLCLEGAEKGTSISKDILIDYEQNCSLPNISVPLNKTVDAGEYQIHIGIPVTSSSEKLIKEITSNPKIKVLDKKNSSNNSELFLKSTYLYNYQVVYQNKANNIFILNLVSKDSSLVQNYFNEGYLLKKMNCEKEHKNK